MAIKKDQEYLSIIDNIINNDKFKVIGNIKHHNTTRLNHSVKVSYYSYKCAKALKLDYHEVARAGLLHDFYTDEIKECDKFKDKFKLFSIKHPKDAANNAMEIVSLSEKEINIIKSHMFPISNSVPKYAESWIVSIVDKVLSVIEFSSKFKYKFIYVFNMYLLFLLNNIK